MCKVNSNQPDARYINPMTDIAEIAKMPMKEREEYRQSLDAFRTNVATYVYEHALGHKEGHEKGLAEGLEKGHLEEKLANAKNFKSLGVSVEIIAQATGLSIDEISKL